MRSLLLTPALLAGCLITADPLKGADSRPSLLGDDAGIVLVSPEGDDPLFAREGTEVVIDLLASIPLAVEAAEEGATITQVRLDGGHPLRFVEERSDAGGPIYRFARTLDGTEDSELKAARAELVSGFDASRSAVVRSQPLFTTDFVPPDAACLLSPRTAGASDAVSLRVTLTEPLAGGAPPEVTADDPRIAVGAPEQLDALEYLFPILPEADANIDGYTVLIQGTDRAGNPQPGTSMCEASSRTGTILGRGPQLDGDVEVEITPGRSNLVQGARWVRTEAGDPTVVTVRIPTVEPIVSTGHTVTLSGLPLTPVPGDPQAWSFAVAEGTPEGAKDLDARLVDAAGNALVLRRTDVVRFDLTPPEADCLISPREALAGDAVTLRVFASEPLLDGAPEVSADAPEIEADLTLSAGSEHRYALSLREPTDLASYTLTLAAVDRAGNPPRGGSLCDEPDRQGSWFGQPLDLTGDVTLDADPSVMDGGVPLAREGATVTVSLATNKAVNTARSRVDLDGALLTPAGPGQWTRVLTGDEGDGLKTLRAELFDHGGNRIAFTRSGVLRTDFTPPQAGCVLSPSQANSGSEVTLLVFPSEPLRGDGPLVSASAPEIDVLPLGAEGSGFRYQLTQITPANLLEYQLTITAEDLAGNPQQGDSLCPASSRSGAWFAIAPSLVGTPSITVTPSITRDGRPVARAGALVTVTLPTAAPISPTASRVRLSGVDLTFDGDHRWTRTLDGSEGDGLKVLDAQLVDPAGNLTAVRSADLPNPIELITDFTAPLATATVLERAPFYAPAVLSDGVTTLFTDRDPFTDAPITATLTVYASEPLAGAANLTVEGPSPASFSGGAPNGNLVSFSRPSVTGMSEGDYRFRVVLTDEVGNTSEPQLLDRVLRVDRTGPSQTPDVDHPSKITYQRRPWGTGSADPAARFRVDGQSFAVIPSATVVARATTGSFLGSAVAGASGTFTDLRIPSDTAEVWLSQLDLAGNPSPQRRVRNIRWEASLGGKVPGSTLTNPHELREALQHRTSRTPPGLRESLSVPAPGAPVSATGGMLWSRASMGPMPTNRINPSASVDPVRGHAVLFGGITQTPFQSSRTLWRWDGLDWLDAVDSADGPRARQYAGLSWDPAAQATLLYGGGVIGDIYDDTWRWSGGGWTRLNPSGDTPGPRMDHAMTHDPRHGRVLLFGGRDTSANFQAGNLRNDTWAWDGRRWQSILTATAPTPRSTTVMVWDPVDERHILFGGLAVNPLGDTWAFDGQDWSSVSASGPDPRHSFCMGWDPVSERIILFGGRDASFTPRADTWAFDGQGWTPLSPAHSPPALAEGVCTQDPVSGELLLLSGRGGASAYNPDLWAWTGETWAPRSTNLRPAVRNSAAMAFDPARGETVFVGGGTGAELGQVWRWDGHRWSVDNDLSPAPPNLERATMAWDPLAEELVLFGGRDAIESYQNLTWAWDGERWFDRSPLVSPPGRWNAAMATVPDGIALHGGNSGNVRDDYWSWLGGTWSNLSFLTGSFPAQDHAMVFDETRFELVSFGPIGGEVFAQTMILDGSSPWTAANPSVQPPSRRWATLSWSPGRERALHFGGESGGADIWQWDGEAWSIAPAVNASLPPYVSARAAFDRTREQLVTAIAPSGLTSGPMQTHLLDTGAQHSPALYFVVDYSAAAAEGPIQAIEARVQAGGTGWPDGQAAHGARLLVWDVDRWRELAAHSATAASPAPLCATIRRIDAPAASPGCAALLDDDALSRLVVGEPRKRIHLAVVPVHPNGPGGSSSAWGEVRVSDASLSVNYRLPAE